MSSSGLTLADSDFFVSKGGANDPTTIKLLHSPGGEPAVEAFFEGTHPIYEGAREDYSSQKIILREKQGSSANTAKGAFVASDWVIKNTGEGSTEADLAANLTLLGLQNLHRPMEIREGTLRANAAIDLKFTAGTKVLTLDSTGNGDTANTAELGGSPSAGDGYAAIIANLTTCLLYTSPSPRDYAASRMPSSA